MSADRLIFISGWATDASCWDSVISEIDGPVSCRHVKWWECLNAAGDENALLRALESEDGGVILVGWSLGTLIALEGALLCPMRVKELVLVSGTARMTSEGSYPGTDSRVLRAMRTRFSRASHSVLEEFARRCIGEFNASSIQAGKYVKEFVDGAVRLNVEHLAAGLRYLQKKDLRNMLPEIKTPAYLLHGNCDSIIPVECARYLEKKLPEARLKEVSGGPHALPFTSPERVAGLIKKLIDADFSSQ